MQSASSSSTPELEPEPEVGGASQAAAGAGDDLFMRLRWVVLAAALLAAVIGLWRWRVGADGGAAGPWVWDLSAATLGVVLAAWAWTLLTRLQRRFGDAMRRHAELAARAAADHRLHRETLDAMQAGVVLFDEQDRVLLSNADFRHLYGPLGERIVPGVDFESLLRSGVELGLVPQAAADPEAWVRERLAQHRNPRGATLRRLPDGRWRRITEQRLPCGKLLAFSIDVSDLVARETELAEARETERRLARRLEDAVDALPDGFVLFDADDRLVMCNQRYRDIYRVSADALQPGARFEDIVRHGLARGQYPQAVGREPAWLADTLAQRVSADQAFLRELPGDRWLRVDKRRTRDGGLTGVFTEVTEQVQRERALEAARAQAQQAQRRLREAVDALPAGVEVYDEHDRLVLFNDELARMYPHVAHEMREGRSFESLVRESLRLGTIPDAVGREEDWLAQRLSLRASRSEPVLQRLPGGRWVHIYESRTASGAVVAVRLDVSHVVAQGEALQAANDRLAELSETDALTGLANRRCVDRRLREEWDRAARHHLPLALLMIDVDHFKRYNDLHGHQAGDACLQQVAQTLARAVGRSTDLVARYGGEEFVVLLPHTTADEARRVAQHLVAAIGSLAYPHGASPVAEHVTVSIGAAMARTETGADLTSLLHDADAALYQAKQAGRHQTGLSPLTVW